MLKKILTEDWLLIGGALALLVILRWNSFGVPFERDEGEYAYSAWLMSRGGVLYKDAFLQKPPLIVYTYWFGQLLTKTGLWPARMLALMSATGVILATSLVIAKKFGRRAGLVGFSLLPIMLSFPYFMGLSANTEIFMLLPLMGVVLIYIWFGEKAKLSYWVLAGGLASLALLYKPICLFVLIWVFGVWVFKSRNFKGVFFAIVSALSVLLLVMLPVILSGGWSYFWEEAVVFNGLYAKSWGFGFTNLFRQLWVMLSKWWVLVIPMVWFFLQKYKNWWFWVGLVLAGFMGVYQTPIGHYYLMLMPFLVVVASVGLVKFMDDIGQKYYWGLLIAVLVMLIPVRSQLAKTPEEINLWVYGTANPFFEAPLVAQKLAEVTDSDNKVFVAGSEPEILYYAKRESVSRFVITYPLIIETPKRLDYQKEIIGELEKEKPTVIVYSTKQHSGLWNEESPKEFIDYLRSLIDSEYEMVGGYVWEINKGYWITEFEEGDLSKASLILYKRRML